MKNIKPRRGDDSHMMRRNLGDDHRSRRIERFIGRGWTVRGLALIANGFSDPDLTPEKPLKALLPLFQSQGYGTIGMFFLMVFFSPDTFFLFIGFLLNHLLSLESSWTVFRARLCHSSPAFNQFMNMICFLSHRIYIWESLYCTLFFSCFV